MARRSIPAAIVLAAAIGALGCGKSKEERTFEELERECNGLVAATATILDADRLFVDSTLRPFTSCASDLAPLSGGNDVCGDPSAGICSTFWYWLGRDPDLCGVNGCWMLCEVRTTEANFRADPQAAPVCASRFFRKQPPPG